MTACALAAAPARTEPVHHDEGTLDELVAAVWRSLRADQSVACPICGAEMSPEYGVHARAIGGSCPSCGARLR